MKTIKEHFEEFPEPYRTQALENLHDDISTKIISHPKLALYLGFQWILTMKGGTYWLSFYKTLEA